MRISKPRKVLAAGSPDDAFATMHGRGPTEVGSCPLVVRGTMAGCLGVPAGTVAACVVNEARGSARDVWIRRAHPASPVETTRSVSGRLRDRVTKRDTHPSIEAGGFGGPLSAARYTRSRMLVVDQNGHAVVEGARPNGIARGGAGTGPSVDADMATGPAGDPLAITSMPAPRRGRTGGDAPTGA